MRKRCLKFFVFLIISMVTTYFFGVGIIKADSVMVEIESEYRYSGMTASYSEGYKPTVKDGKVTVVLPLAVDSNFDAPLTVRADTGTQGPLIGANQYKQVECSRHSSPEKSIYVAEFEFALERNYSSGTYAVNFSVSGSDEDGNEVSASFVVYVVLEDGKGGFEFVIANDKVYEGMNRSYQDGYIPTVENDIATVILPLEVIGKYTGSVSVTARTTDSTVFSGVNYNKTFDRQSDGNYLIEFELPLNVSRRNGSYPVEFTVTADSTAYSFTVYVVISDEVKSGFYLDNQNVYANMDASYAGGYKPTVANGKATVILPIKTESRIQGDIKVKADITDNTNETFEMRNYEKPVALGTDGVYLVRFDFNLLSTRRNGVYTVKFTVSAVTTTGETIEETFTVYVTVSDGEDLSSTVPNIIVESFSLNESYLAGEEFTGILTLKNVNKNTEAHHIQIRVSPQNQGIEFLNNTNTVYLENMESNSLELALDFKTLSDAAAGKHSVNLDITYEDENGSSRSLSAVVYINIRQIPRVELETKGLDSRITAGDTVSLTADVYNMGKSSIYNVILRVEGYGLLPSKSGYIGTMNAENGESVSIDVFVGSKTMSSDYTGTEKYGFTEGKLILTYEDSEGTEYMEEYKISTQIAAPASSDSSTTAAATESSWWISLIASGCILIFTGVYLFFTKNRKKWSVT